MLLLLGYVKIEEIVKMYTCRNWSYWKFVEIYFIFNLFKVILKVDLKLGKLSKWDEHSQKTKVNN